MTKILITGANGLLGQALVNYLSQDFEVLATGIEPEFSLGNQTCEFKSFDITDFSQTKEIFSNFRPDVVINTASLTNVDDCEVNRNLCWNVNVKGVENLAKAAKKYMTLLIQLSTDYVFDGEEGPYNEEARPHPLGYYAKSKLASENLSRMSGIPYAIVRTSVLYGLGNNVKKNFFLWLYNKLKNNVKVNIVTDQYNTPTLVDDLAIGIKQLIHKSAYGVYHISGGDFLNRYDFANLLAKIAGFSLNLIEPVTTDFLKQVAPRPVKAGLTIDKAIEKIDYQPQNTSSAFEYLISQIGTPRKNL
jgi:dTDP-4-dehydrorhamnose reductase